MGRAEGLPAPSVITCDNLITVLLDSLDHEPIGRLDRRARIALDQALRHALDIRY